MPVEIPAAFETGVVDPAADITGIAKDSPEDGAGAPSSPYMFPPQQYAAPEDVTAHEWEPPADTETASVRVAWEPPTDAITVVGEARRVLIGSPFPSSPFVLEPQHMTRPDCCTAHVWDVPADTASAGSDPSRACTGVALDPLAPSPSSPLNPLPQQRTEPLVVTAHE